MSRDRIAAALAQIFSGISSLKEAFPNREFTIDGRLVGDVGEVIAALEYDIVLDSVQRPRHDAKTSDGRDVQIKATFKNHLTIRATPDYYLGFQLFADGNFEEVFNGPGSLISKEFGHRKGFGKNSLAIPVSALNRLSANVSADQRIARREV